MPKDTISDADRLRPATPAEIADSLSFALRYDGRRRVHHADDAMARITADRLVAHLTRSGFVLMKRPDAAAPSAKSPWQRSWRRMTGYAELQVTSNFSFLRGASHVEELFAQAKRLGLAALGITDRNSLAGIVRAHQRAAETGVRLVVGCRLDLRDGTALLVYPTDRPAYSRLCRLLTLGKARAGKGKCDLSWQDLAVHAEGMIAILVPDAADAELAARLARLRRDFGDRAYLALTLRRRPGDAVRLRELSDMAQAARVPTVATGDVLYHVPQRRILQDVLTCIREGTTIDDAGFRRERFADRHLKPPEEMTRLFARHPDAVARSLEIVERCRFSLSELRYQYPDEVDGPGQSPQQKLERLVRDSAAEPLSGRVAGGGGATIAPRTRADHRP